MPQIDTVSPGFVVTVIATREELRIQSLTDPNALGQVLDRMTDVTPRVTSLTFEDDERKLDVLKLVVDNSDLYFFEHPAWVKGNLVRFFFGYPGRIFGPRYMVVDNMQGFLTLKITCVEETHLVNEAQCNVFENVTRQQVVQSLIDRGALPGVTRVVFGQTEESEAEGAQDFQQTRQSDWQFLQALAEPIHFEVFVENDTLFFAPRQLSQVPVREFEYYFGMGDLLDFKLNQWRVADRAASTTVEGRDPVERTNHSSTGSDSETARDTLGTQGVLVLEAGRTGAIVAGSTIDPSPEPPATVAAEASSNFQRNEQDEIKATGTLIGDPLLASKRLIVINGISRPLEGRYYITKHTHKFTDKGGYVSVLKLLRNAMTSAPTQDPPTLDSANATNNENDADTSRELVIRPTGAGALLPLVQEPR